MNRPGSALRSPALAEGESPRIAVVIQHVESRAHLIERLLDRLGEVPVDAPGWQRVSVVTGDLEARDPWATYKLCLAQPETPGGRNLLPPTPEPATHLVIVQDDALLVPRFYERLLAHVAERPDDVLCCYVPAQPAYMARAVHQAFASARRFAALPGGMFTPLVCTSWPVLDAADCLIWDDAQVTARHRRCDDAQVARWLSRRRRFAQAIVPSLADHDELTPSTLGLGRYRRHAAIVAAASG